MAKVSPSLHVALQNLARQIEAAERYLHKLPGSAKAAISIDDVFGNDANGDAYWVMQPVRDNGMTRLWVRELVAGSPRAQFTLDNTNVVQRIEIARYIPELITAARTGELEIAHEADEVSAMIEHAIADDDQSAPRVQTRERAPGPRLARG